jgi:FkbM family methyltransferase
MSQAKRHVAIEDNFHVYSRSRHSLARAPKRYKAIQINPSIFTDRNRFWGFRLTPPWCISNIAKMQKLPFGPDVEGLSESAPEVFHAPNGLEIYHHAASETKYVYQEIFEDRVYFRHGISLTPGEWALDVGANIGLFTLFLKENFKEVKVCAFEPSPSIFRLLKANVAKYGDAVSVYNCGLSNSSGEATFTYYPHYSIMSGFHAEPEQDKETLRKGIRRHLEQQAFDPQEIQDRALDRMVKVALGQKREHICQLRTISNVIDEKRIKKISLLKIDAEGSELNILDGIRTEHWNQIRQIVMEIHDAKDTACQQVKSLLEARGYACIFEQEKRLAGSGIFTCYASRR